jgi:hypothetical protein
MNDLFLKRTALLFVMSLSASITTAMAQTPLHSQDMDMKLTGTSNLHDWEMNAAHGTSKATFLIDKKGKVVSMSQLGFSFPAKNLKSDHTAMDKNTYKALRTDKNPNISFVGTSSSIKSTGGNNYTLNCNGRMTIAGVTNATNLIATGVYNPATGSFTITGVKKMKMTDYNVKPPTAVMGTIKTGDDIILSYNVKFTK